MAALTAVVAQPIEIEIPTAQRLRQNVSKACRLSTYVCSLLVYMPVNEGAHMNLFMCVSFRSQASHVVSRSRRGGPLFYVQRQHLQSPVN